MKKISILILILLVYSCSFIKDTCYSRYDKFQLQKNDNMLFLPLTLNGKKVLFLIDTGANKSIIDRNKATKYGYECAKFKEGRYIGIGGSTDFYVVYNYKITEFFISLVAIDMEELSPAFKNAGVDIVGIIGSDFFSSTNAVIDFETGILYYIGYK